MLTGQPVTADRALGTGLMDRIVGGDVIDAAVELIASGRAPLCKTGALPPPPDLAAGVDQWRRRLAAMPGLAPTRIIDCVAAIDDDFCRGTAREAAAFDELAASEESRALREAFFSRRSKKVRAPGLAGQ